MDIVLNDYSLSGQFASTDEFALWIQRECKKMFDYLMENKIPLYKTLDFYSKYITPDKTIGDLLRMTGDPIIANIRTFIINSAYSPPYWDEDEVMKTDCASTYDCLGIEDFPNCFSEAIERDKIVFSIKNDCFKDDIYLCYKNGELEEVKNITDFNSFLCLLLSLEKPDVKYVFENYRFQREIKFLESEGRCYAEEAILNNELTVGDMRNILLSISQMINGLSTGTKNRFWASVTDGIFEYRISISNGREFRLFFVQDRAIYFLNGFIKKEQKTPKYEIDKAKRIKREIFKE